MKRTNVRCFHNRKSNKYALVAVLREVDSIEELKDARKEVVVLETKDIRDLIQLMRTCLHNRLRTQVRILPMIRFLEKAKENGHKTL